MRVTFIKLLVLSTLALVCSWALAKSMADETNKPQNLPIYNSPRAVYDAFRMAISNEDWRAVYSCLTPQMKLAVVWELLEDSYISRETKTIEEVRKKYGFDANAAMLEYNRRIKEKQGVLPHEQQVRLPDRSLIQEIVSAQITDKEGFFVEMTKALGRSELEPELGELEQIQVEGEKATGRANKMVFHLEGGVGVPDRKVGEKITATFRFSKEKGSWLIDTPPK